MPPTQRDRHRAVGTASRGRAVLLGWPLFAALWLLLPTMGPVLRNFSVASGSMEPALPRLRTMIVSRAAYGYSRHSFDLVTLPIRGRWPDIAPRRGDIVAYRLPRDTNSIFVKRVVGLPGDVIEMRKGQLYINAAAVQRMAYAAGLANRDPESPRGFVPAYVETLPNGPSYVVLESNGDAGALDDTPPVAVPAGHLFMLGDNRDDSTDSRASAVHGTLPIDHIIGRVIYAFGTTAIPPPP